MKEHRGKAMDSKFKETIQTETGRVPLLLGQSTVQPADPICASQLNGRFWHSVTVDWKKQSVNLAPGLWSSQHFQKRPLGFTRMHRFPEKEVLPVNPSRLELKLNFPPYFHPCSCSLHHYPSSRQAWHQKCGSKKDRKLFSCAQPWLISGLPAGTSLYMTSGERPLFSLWNFHSHSWLMYFGWALPP